MEGLLDRTSPRRGSLTLHRQSSGSFSSTCNPKFASPSQHQASGNDGTSSNSSPCPDLDRYTRYFIIKAVQIIVQSRVCGNKEMKSECKPNGNDWFNINLTDVAEISERTKAAIDTEGVSIKSNWRVCCEISLKTGDGHRVTLEEWLISNRTISMLVPPNSSASSPSTHFLNSANHKAASPQLQQQNHSPSCVNNTSTISNSNLTQNTQNKQQYPSSNSAPSSIYTIYNRMTLLLKTLMTTTHIVPAFRLASKVTHPNVICYRVYTVAPYTSCQNLASPILLSPVKGSSNRSIDCKNPVGCVNNVDQQFGPLVKLGAIKTDTNELSISYRTDINSSNHLLGSSRACDQRQNQSSLDRIKGMVQDEEYLTAAKQLLAGNGNHTNPDLRRKSTENLDSLDQPLMPAFATKIASTVPAASNVAQAHINDNEASNRNDTSNHPYGELIESAFVSLLNCNGDADSETFNNNNYITAAAATTLAGAKHQNGCERSANIQVPKPNNVNGRRGRRESKSQVVTNVPSSGSTPKSLSDSYVFVDINPPFASEEQNDINSFFHGPSPSFSNGFDRLKDVDELAHQLATIEASASQIDDFVDNICISENEEEDYDRERSP